MLGEAPSWLGERRVYLVDASNEPVHGSDKTDFRLHYAIGMFDLGMKEMALTDTKTGEKISNFKAFGENDVVIRDRAYCSKQGMTYLSEKGSDYLFRYKTNMFHLYNDEGKRVNLLGYFKGLRSGECVEKTLYYEREGRYVPLRFCVMRKTAEAEQRGLAALHKTRMRKYGNKDLSEAQIAYNRYIILVTSLCDTDPNLLLDLYRQRWHREPAFKRLKSLFKYNEIPVHLEQSAKAWFYGKLLLAALCETWVNKGRFSPSAENHAPQRMVCVV
jgi:hypothetical protein